MKRVMFDLLFSQPLDGTKFHGGGEYIKRVFLELVKKYSTIVHIVAFYNYDEFLDDWIKELIYEYEIETVNIRNLAELQTYLKKEKIDVFYTGMPYSYSEEILPKEIERIATFHGMRATECPHDQYEYKYADTTIKRIKSYAHYFLRETPIGYSKDRWNSILKYEKCISAFNKIICDSEHTKYSLLNYFTNIKSDDIEVYYPPLKISSTSKNLIEKYYDYGKYILILGANRWQKNAYRGITAIDDLYNRGKITNVKTVVVGNFPTAIKKEISNLDKFVFYDYVKTDDLECLYQNCSVFLYSTLNEGFGYPPLEAMRYGKTCVVSAVCSLTEICGNAVYYINPYDIGEIQNRLLHAIYNPIDENTIMKQLNKVQERQNIDLTRLCLLLVNGGNAV